MLLPYIIAMPMAVRSTTVRSVDRSAMPRSSFLAAESMGHRGLLLTDSSSIVRWSPTEQLFSRTVEISVLIGLSRVFGSGVFDSTVSITLMVSTEVRAAGSLLKSIGSVSGVPVDP